MLWNQTYGVQNYAVVCAKQTKDGGYVMAAVQNVTEAWLLETDSAGGMIWNLTFAGATFFGEIEANYNCIIQTADDSLIVLGTKDGNVWLTKLSYLEVNPLSLIQVQVAIAMIVIAALAIFAFALLRRRGKRANATYASSFSRLAVSPGTITILATSPEYTS
jgi:hypothetical protein